MPSDIASLIARVEAASGPDRVLDAMIHHAIKDGVGTGYAADAPTYTASLDAAMTLAGDPALTQYGGPVGLLRWAIDNMDRAGHPIAALPRWIAAACLRAMQDQAK